jgi:hypothetical protein
MINVLIGIILGASLAMMFPEHAAESYEFVRGAINTVASTIADSTDEPTTFQQLTDSIQELQ